MHLLYSIRRIPPRNWCLSIFSGKLQDQTDLRGGFLGFSGLKNV